MTPGRDVNQRFGIRYLPESPAIPWLPSLLQQNMLGLFLGTSPVDLLIVSPRGQQGSILILSGITSYFRKYFLVFIATVQDLCCYMSSEKSAGK
jgi:hypothetical protein